MADETRASRKVRTGVVVSDAMDKTRVVRVDRTTSHALYSKRVSRSKKYHMHDETNESHVGDTVEMMETRPISASKRWRLVRVVEKAK